MAHNDATDPHLTQTRQHYDQAACSGDPDSAAILAAELDVLERRADRDAQP